MSVFNCMQIRKLISGPERIYIHRKSDTIVISNGHWIVLLNAATKEVGEVLGPHGYLIPESDTAYSCYDYSTYKTNFDLHNEIERILKGMEDKREFRITNIYRANPGDRMVEVLADIKNKLIHVDKKYMDMIDRYAVRFWGRSEKEPIIITDAADESNSPKALICPIFMCHDMQEQLILDLLNTKAFR